MNTLRNFWNDERSHPSQRLIEYTLLLALVVVGSSVILLRARHTAGGAESLTGSTQLVLRARTAGE